MSYPSDLSTGLGTPSFHIPLLFTTLLAGHEESKFSLFAGDFEDKTVIGPDPKTA